MIQRLTLFFSFLAILILPFAFSKKSQTRQISEADYKVVVITPHNEVVRQEFSLAFEEWFYHKTGKTVIVDWRILGGTRETMKYIDSQYLGSFQYYWETILSRPWSYKVSNDYNNFRVELPKNADDYNEGQLARSTYLNSSISCGMDVLFGGGEIDIMDQAQKGNLVSSGLQELKPYWFGEESLPYSIGNVVFWDQADRWVATAHSGLGMIYNQDALDTLGVTQHPEYWGDLAKPQYFGQVALADPAVSSSINRAFDFLIQERMQHYLDPFTDQESDDHPGVRQAVRDGWHEGFNIIQKVSANARYFTDSSSKPVLDVSSGDCAVGVCIDYYGLSQESNIQERTATDRFHFVMPKAGSVVTPDGVGMFRGAPNPEIALAFIEFTVSLEGQKIWAFKKGAPGGPKNYPINRPAMRKEIYDERYDRFRANPNVNAYNQLSRFNYHPKWTKPLVESMRFIMKAAFVDAHEELAEAWSSIIEAREAGLNELADAAQAVMEDIDCLQYDVAMDQVKTTLESGDRLAIFKLQNYITNTARAQYLQAIQMIKKA